MGPKSSLARPPRSMPYRPKNPRPESTADSRLARFRRLVKQSGSQSIYFGRDTSAQSLFALGLEILNNASDAGSKQEVITLLASEEGLSCIRDVANTRVPRVMASTPAVKLQLWLLEVCPLFGIAVHDNLVNSALLEDKAAVIHNFLLGVGGARMTTLFDFVIDLASTSPRPPDLSVIFVAELSLNVLSTLLNSGTSLIVNEAFQRYTDRLRTIAEAFDTLDPQQRFSKAQALQYAAFIGRRLQVGSSIPNADSAPRAAPVELASFRLRQDMPGELSANGARHDNDHADIRKISIMPTPGEIRSARTEYLPTTDLSSWHISGIRGRLDREFRLLREDTVGQLRDVVRFEIDRLQKQSNTKNGRTTRHRNKDNIHYCVYEDAVISSIGFDKFAGPEFLVRVRQPAQGRATKQGEKQTTEEAAKSFKKRCNWWNVQARKRLQPGGLVCSLDVTGSASFFTVGDSTMRSTAEKSTRSRGKGDNGEANPRKTYTLADDPGYAYVHLTLSGVGSQDALSSALGWYRQSMMKQGSRLLIEFPGVLLASFFHTLQALQSGMASLNMPFADIIAPETGNSEQPTEPVRDVPPPRYFQRPGFYYDMSCLTTNRQTLQHSLEAPATVQDVQEKTQLDGTQATALLEALSRSVALIQGPPGTGKTFVGVQILKVLLENRKKAKLGPIVIVCYTNHALDQLLEHVLDSRPGVNILRMGSQSKSERLNNLNLREAARKLGRTRAESHSVGQTMTALEDVSEQIEKQLHEMRDATSPGAVRRYLQVHNREAYEGIIGPSSDDVDDGFVTVRGNADDTFRRWRNGKQLGPNMPARDERLWTMPKMMREALYKMWQSETFKEAITCIEATNKSYEASKKASDRAKREVDLRCMQEADIVGMTTTGLARSSELLRSLRSKVLLCEEAGEVLEAHMLVSFLPSIEHAILIGDHLQLRPQVQNYELSSESQRGQQFSFDRSLFERLVSPPLEGEAAVPYSQLTTQRRMHPSISALIRARIYPALEDSPNVQDYPQVSGMARRLFWFQHENLEDGAAGGVEGNKEIEEGMSRTNSFEVEMTAALVSHLFKQGTYSGGDIAVLTPYLGQMQLLRRRLSTMFELTFNERDTADLEAVDELEAQGSDDHADSAGSTSNNDARKASNAHDKRLSAAAKTTLLNSVRVATVDNFQGEEAKVVVVSLVRSNEQRRCGFLRTSNRINVLLSRAKHGMYILGNGETYSGVPMWQSVLSALESDDNLGRSLPVQCPRHPERVFGASLPDHFAMFAPDGGCMQSCDKRLACGHSCTGRCHADMIHAAVKCLEPCPRSLKGCSHACTNPCGSPCVQTCRVPLPDKLLALPCGHTIKTPQCWQTQRPKEVVCREDVKRTIPGCGHVVTLSCHVEFARKDFKCRAQCGAMLPCGHSCGRSCDSCNVRADDKVVEQNHGACTKTCGRPYGTCGHACQETCHGDKPCPPCQAPCDTRCSHSKCSRLCNEPCVPCAEDTCASSCPHSVCTMPCAAPCNWIPCSKRCQEKLDCGHQCPSVCGEQCPDARFCQICGDTSLLDQTVDFIVMSTYRETDLDEDPCIFPSCGHIMTMSSMDGIMDMAKHYVMEESSASGLSIPAAIAAPSSPFDMNEAKVCPNCRGSLRNIARYGRIVRRAVLDESTKRFIRWAHQQHGELALQLMQQKELLETGLAAASPAGSNANRGSPSTKVFYGKGRSALIKELLLSIDRLRFDSLIKTRAAIIEYSSKVAEDEQPYKRVADLVQFALRRRDENASILDSHAPGHSGHFVFDESVIQVGGSLQAELLLMRCDILALEQVAASLEKSSSPGTAHTAVSLTRANQDAKTTSAVNTLKKLLKTVQFADLLNAFEAFIAAACSAKHTRQQAEGHISCVQLCLVLWKLYGWKDADSGASPAPPRPPAAAAAAAAAPAAAAAAPAAAAAAPAAAAAVGGGGGGGGGEGIPAENGQPEAAAVQEDSDAGDADSESRTKSSPLSREWLKKRAEKHVKQAQDLAKANPSLEHQLGGELQRLEAALANIVDYRPVSTAEMRAVYEAMAREFVGSGHWYTCANGHPFTVGECGMPMERARCPECGAAVGGQDHMNAEGVQRANAIEELGRA